MTNVQLYLAYIIPMVTVVIGIVLNRSDNAAIRAEMAQFRTELRNEMAQLRSEMLQLRDSIHRDMVSLHERVAVVESKHS